MTIDPLTRAELEHNATTASLMAERRRAQWRTAVPTSTRSAALAREVRSWEAQAASWTAVLALVDAAAMVPVLTPKPQATRYVLKSIPHPYGGAPTVVQVAEPVPNPGVNCLDQHGNAGLTAGELLRTPKSLHYCARPGCGHGDRIHGPFCFAAGCMCLNWVWEIRECQFCDHPYHGPDTWEGMDVCTRTGCACLAERMARR